MAKLTKKSVFKTHNAQPETAMEKTTRIVKKMVEDDAEKRETKMNRLRTARLEREANTPLEKTQTPRKKAAPKGAAK